MRAAGNVILAIGVAVFCYGFLPLAMQMGGSAGAYGPNLYGEAILLGILLAVVGLMMPLVAGPQSKPGADGRAAVPGKAAGDADSGKGLSGEQVSGVAKPAGPIAMTPCPACGRNLSAAAQACPGCGHPASSKSASSVTSPSTVSPQRNIRSSTATDPIGTQTTQPLNTTADSNAEHQLQQSEWLGAAWAWLGAIAVIAVLFIAMSKAYPTRTGEYTSRVASMNATGAYGSGRGEGLSVKPTGVAHPAAAPSPAELFTEAESLRLNGQTVAARAAYSAACDANNDVACLRLAGLEADGAGGPKNKDAAEKLAHAHVLPASRSCDSGDLPACVAVADTMALGTEVAESDLNKVGIPLYRNACDGGNLNGCTSLGWLIMPAEHEKAIELIEKACMGGAMASCRSLGLGHEIGVNGMTVDHVRAAGYYRQACDGGDLNGCSFLAELYKFGKGVVKDPTRAAELLKKGCDGGHAFACYELGEMYALEDDDPSQRKAAALFAEACDGWVMGACEWLASSYETGKGVTKDEARARELYAKACQGGEKSACRGGD